MRTLCYSLGVAFDIAKEKNAEVVCVMFRLVNQDLALWALRGLGKPDGA